MASSSETIDRRVVPRWRQFGEALKTGELDPAKAAESQGISGGEFLKEREDAWHESRAMPFAVDLVSAATVIGKTGTSVEAAEFILENGASASEIAVKIAGSLLGTVDVPAVANPQLSRIQIIERLKEFKQKRINQTMNAFVWTDLARLYTLLAQNESAWRALSVALKLAPTERFVLRCMARFLHHVHKYEEAVHLLRGNARTPYDPWLMAAEIAASSIANRTPRFSKSGLELLKQGDLLPFHTSELASALASLEMDAGSDRKANKLFVQSLKQPTDNALAQAVWASKRTGLGSVNVEKFRDIRTAEASALYAFNECRWRNVIAQAERWEQEEGFSVRPPSLSSFTAASFLDDLELAEKIAKRGLVTNPRHPLLINNIAFAQILSGKPEKGMLTLSETDAGAVRRIDKICLLATTGLAWFRLGDEQQGRKCYHEAIDAARGAEEVPIRTVATLYFAREEVIRGNKAGWSDFKRAYDAAQKLQRTYIPQLADHLAKDVEIAASRAGMHLAIRREKKDVADKGLF